MLNFALYIFIVLVWGSTWYAIKFQLGVVPIEWSLVYRFAFSSFILFLICFATKRRLKFERKHHILFAGMGLCLFGVNYYFSYIGVVYLTSGLVAVAFSTLNLMNIFNSRIFLKKTITNTTLLGAGVGFFGILLIFWPEIISLDPTNNTIIGLSVALAGAYTASLGNTIAATKIATSLPVMPMNAWGMFYGTIILGISALLQGKPPALDLSTPYLLSFLFLTFFGTVIVFNFFLILIARMGLEKTSYFAVLFPIVALIISTVYENYQWSPMALAGVGFVLTGNVIIIWKKTHSTN